MFIGLGGAIETVGDDAGFLVKVSELRTKSNAIRGMKYLRQFYCMGINFQPRGDLFSRCALIVSSKRGVIEKNFRNGLVIEHLQGVSQRQTRDTPVMTSYSLRRALQGR